MRLLPVLAVVVLLLLSLEDGVDLAVLLPLVAVPEAPPAPDPPLPPDVLAPLLLEDILYQDRLHV
jgi:hypothetical protein